MEFDEISDRATQEEQIWGDVHRGSGAVGGDSTGCLMRSRWCSELDDLEGPREGTS